MTEMLFTRVRAFLEEFPFVRRYVEIDRFGQRPTVQRIDLDLLDRCAETWLWCYRHLPWRIKKAHVSYSTRLVLIATDGTELGEAQPDRIVGGEGILWRPSTWFSDHVQGETVMRAIQRIRWPDQLGFILEIRDFRGPNTAFYPDYGLEVTVHKIPSGKSFVDWLTNLREVAAKELQAEVIKVNQV